MVIELSFSGPTGRGVPAAETALRPWISMRSGEWRVAGGECSSLRTDCQNFRQLMRRVPEARSTVPPVLLVILTSTVFVAVTHAWTAQSLETIVLSAAFTTSPTATP